MYKIILILILPFFNISGFAQQKKMDSLKFTDKQIMKEIDSFMKIDFLDKKYKYLDESFKINIDSISFEKINNNPRRSVLNYNDSIKVILRHNLGYGHKYRIASNRILFKWKKLAYYIWQTENSTKLLGNSLGFRHPYRFYEYLMDENINTPEKLKILEKLKCEIKPFLTEDIDIKPYKPFLNKSFKLNPKRIKAMNEYMRKHGKHKH